MTQIVTATQNQLAPWATEAFDDDALEDLLDIAPQWTTELDNNSTAAALAKVGLKGQLADLGPTVTRLA